MPDLSGCFTSGETVKDAQTQAVKAIKCYLAGLLLDSEPIPTPPKISLPKRKTEPLWLKRKKLDFRHIVWYP